jgi:hypothetical protein
MVQPHIPGNVTPNPWVYQALDFAERAITITFPWNASTRALQNATIERDQGCLYSTIYIGFGGDGRVESSSQKIPVQQGVGARTFSAGQLGALGLNTIDDILDSQITAAP